jgi:hypothetical protein
LGTVISMKLRCAASLRSPSHSDPTPIPQRSRRSHGNLVPICHYARPQPCKIVGYARGVHKQGGFQTANGNLPIELRFAERHIHIPVLARNKTIKKHGLARVLCGVDKSGKKHDEPCFARDIYELYDGVRCEIPDDRNGGVRTIRIRWFFIVLCADMLGANAILPYMETPGANLCCSGCDWDKSQPDAHKPFSFLRGGKTGKGRKRKRWQLRDWEAEKVELERLRAMPATKAAKGMSARGFNKLHCAAEHLRGVRPDIIAPRDPMHVLFDGCTRSELAHLIFTLNKAGVKVERINRAVQSYRHFPPDVRIPQLSNLLAKGTKLGQPVKARVVSASAFQIMHLTLHRLEMCHSMPSLPLISCHRHLPRSPWQ